MNRTILVTCTIVLSVLCVDGYPQRYRISRSVGSHGDIDPGERTTPCRKRRAMVKFPVDMSSAITYDKANNAKGMDKNVYDFDKTVNTAKENAVDKSSFRNGTNKVSIDADTESVREMNYHLSCILTVCFLCYCINVCLCILQIIFEAR
ncbi:hypothetical protein M8J76_004771 [Diaphorina citri]|nr:hypothetical protein M8J75_003634 [Diaphorina citri]KAI5736566.1 hypothetical protein M8J76_004771 [Diaphorina citri]